MAGPSGMRYEVTAAQCIANFFRGLAGARVCYGTREYSRYYAIGWGLSCGAFWAVITSPLWAGGMLVGFFLDACSKT
jgi:hypothetical protein